MENAVFENTIVKLQRSQLDELRANELQIVKRFQVQNEILDQDSTMTFKREALHKFNMTRIHAGNDIDKQFIVPTTNLHGDKFAIYRHADTHNRSRLSTTDLEAQLFSSLTETYGASPAYMTSLSEHDNS